jgi:two-component system alkaline phosphatase synthesis response regulator PhoP
LNDRVRKALAIGTVCGVNGSFRGLLQKAAIELIEVSDGGTGLKAFYAERPDVLLLELDLPDRDGFEVLGTVRGLSDVPVLATTSDEDGGLRTRALRAGADDCITQPTSEQEIVARIEALLRRTRGRPEIDLILDDEFIHIDHLRHRVEVLGNKVDLTPIEFRMLNVFAENPGRVLSHGQLLDQVWGDKYRDKDEVKLYVSYLRRKLAAAAEVDPVETVRGVGYKYSPRKIPRPRAEPS